MDPYLARLAIDIGGFVFASIVIGFLLIAAVNFVRQISHDRNQARLEKRFPSYRRVGFVRFNLTLGNSLIWGLLTVGFFHLVDAVLSGDLRISCGRLALYADRDC